MCRRREEHAKKRTVCGPRHRVGNRSGVSKGRDSYPCENTDTDKGPQAPSSPPVWGQEGQPVRVCAGPEPLHGKPRASIPKCGSSLRAEWSLLRPRPAQRSAWAAQRKPVFSACPLSSLGQLFQRDSLPITVQVEGNQTQLLQPLQSAGRVWPSTDQERPGKGDNSGALSTSLGSPPPSGINLLFLDSSQGLVCKTTLPCQSHRKT